jgi:hypothetical protein
MFSLFNRQKSKAGEKSYMPEDRASDALQNLVYIPLLTQIRQGLAIAREILRSCIFTVLPLKVGLQK